MTNNKKDKNRKLKEFVEDTKKGLYTKTKPKNINYKFTRIDIQEQSSSYNNDCFEGELMHGITT